jgi:predicted PurR-regulated permease PerM
MRPLPVKVFSENVIRTAGNQDLVNGLVIFLAVCAVLFYGQQILIPIVLAILLSLLLAPCVRALQKLRVPKSAAIISVVCIAFALLFAMTAVLATSLTNLAGDLPRYESNLREKARSLKFATSGGDTIEKAANVLKDLRTELQQPQQSSLTNNTSNRPIPVEIREPNFGPLDPVISAVAILIHPMTQLGIVILMVVLILFNREDLRNRLVRLAGTGDIHRTTLALDEAGDRLSLLFTTQLLINGLTGAFIGIALAVIGIPGAILWGVLTAVMRFVPYVGIFMSAVFPIIIAAAIGDGWTLALMTAGIIIVVEIAVGQVLEPLFFGKMTGLSTFAIVASAAFWATLWGPIGLILATPLTVGLLVIGRNIESLKFFDVLLGSEAVLTPDHVFYQRLLADDPIEAAEQADVYLKEDKLGDFLNDVAVPGLMLANYDHTRGVLSTERLTAIAHSFSETLDELWVDGDSAVQKDVPVLLISAHGPLNFAAALAFSALLKTRGVSHQMLPEEVITPGKFPEIDMTNVGFVCLCYLTAPSEAKHSYVLRRISSLVKEARVISVAWSGSADRMQVQSPANAVSLLPTTATKPEESTDMAEPIPVAALQI